MSINNSIMQKKIFFIILVISCMVIAVSADSAPPQDSPVPAKNKTGGVLLKNHSELNATGYRLLGEKRYREAETFFLLAAQQSPASKYYHNNLAVAYMNQGKYHMAYSRLQIAIALDKSYVRALSNMAVTCFYLLKFREAYAYYRKVNSIDAAYALDRFERNRVIDRIESLKRENPNNKELYFILRHLKKQPDALP